MSVSREEYKRILADQEAGRLAIMIDTAAFRKLLVDKVDPSRFAATVGQPIESGVRLIRTLTWLDAMAPFVASLLSVLAFGWWGLLGVVGSFLGWAGYKTRASRGRQHVIPVVISLLMYVMAAFILPLPNWWARGFVVSLGVMFVLGRALYLTTAHVVFSLIHSSYEFFDLFYLQPPAAIVPLIWTTEVKAPRYYD